MKNILSTSVKLQLLTLTSAVAVLPVQAQTLLVDFTADNYSVPTTGLVGGVWTDSSGNANDATAVDYYISPGYVANATPSGKAAVDFGYNGYQQISQPTQKKPLALANSLTSASFSTAPDFTFMAVAYVPEGYSTSNLGIINSSNNGGFSWRLNTDGTQNLSVLNQSNVGTSTGTTYTTGTWAMFTVTYGNGNYAFYLNDELVGSGTSTKTFTAATSTLITSSLATIAGPIQIAALQAYDGAMDSTQVSALYSTVYDTYMIPEPSDFALMMGLGLTALALVRRRRLRA